MSFLHITSIEKYNQLIKEAKYLVIDFYADWCGPCVKLSKTIDSWIKNKIYGKVIFAKINTDDDTFSELIKELEINTIPRIMIYRAGKLISDIKGGDPKKIQLILDEFN